MHLQVRTAEISRSYSKLSCPWLVSDLNERSITSLLTDDTGILGGVVSTTGTFSHEGILAMESERQVPNAV